MIGKKIEHLNICLLESTDHSPGWERTKVIPGNLLIREFLLEGGTAKFCTASLEIQFISFPGNSERGIINNFAVF